MANTTRDALTASLQRFGIQRDRMRAALARQARISATDLDALEHLEAEGPLTQRDLGERLAVTSGAVTMLVDRLERAGWVRRRPHPTDRRYVLLELTSEATQLAPAGLVNFHAAIQKLVANVPAADRAVIEAFLRGASDAADGAARDLDRR
jgi:DNA-binding MarR family transcriptional regulator